MIRKIVDYQKLNDDILNLLVEKFPDGYDDDQIISFRNAKKEIIEAVEVKTDDTIYLVKVGKKLVKAMEDYDFDDDEETSNDNDDNDEETTNNNEEETTNDNKDVNLLNEEDFKSLNEEDFENLL